MPQFSTSAIVAEQNDPSAGAGARPYQNAERSSTGILRQILSPGVTHLFRLDVRQLNLQEHPISLAEITSEQS